MPPPCVPGARPARPSNMIGMRPAMTSLSDTAAPAACTNDMFTLALSRNSSPVRCAWPPRLVAANSMPSLVLLASCDQLGDAVGRDVLVDARPRSAARRPCRSARTPCAGRPASCLPAGSAGRCRSRPASCRACSRPSRRAAAACAAISPPAPGRLMHHDLLLPHLRQLVGDDARHHVRAVAGGGGVMKVHRLVGIILRLRGRRSEPAPRLPRTNVIVDCFELMLFSLSIQVFARRVSYNTPVRLRKLRHETRTLEAGWLKATR